MATAPTRPAPNMPSVNGSGTAAGLAVHEPDPVTAMGAMRAEQSLLPHVPRRKKLKSIVPPASVMSGPKVEYKESPCAPVRFALNASTAAKPVIPPLFRNALADRVLKAQLLVDGTV